LEVPVEIWEVTDAEALQLELLENFQREDLNPIEEAEGVMRMLEISLDLERSEVISLLNRKARQRRSSSADNVVRTKKRSQKSNDTASTGSYIGKEEEQYQQIEEIFNLIGKYTPESFRTHRLPLLNLPQSIIESVKTGELEYTKARLIARIKDKDAQKDVLTEAIKSELSHVEVNRLVEQTLAKSRANKPLKNEQQQFQFRATALMRQLKAVKLEEQTRRKVEKLMAQIEKLLPNVD
jgi:ParB family transcriptional regulator, chromosome partitioning protein